MDYVRALVEVTVGRSGGLPALPMLPGETLTVAEAHEGIVVGGEVAPGYRLMFELTDEANPAPEPE